ncbi:MAG: FAD:protein FMN transferase ApbE [Proteobacteria bacterium]|nr:FAD:protein FMN transferase ApbE [Pseudomonadota bacterium]
MKYSVWRYLAMIVGLLVVNACGSDQDADSPLLPARYTQVQGNTMGTYYRVQYRQSARCAVSQSELDSLLIAFNNSLSTYVAESEISTFNGAPAQQWVALSPRFNNVMQAALEVWRQSAGAFDVTIGPLVNLWGFGPGEVVNLPTPEAQRRAARWVGMQRLQLDYANALAQKDADAVYVDLSALAKGLGVDELADYLRATGCKDFMVDIGGEMRTQGSNASGAVWRIGVEKPLPGGRGSIQRVLTLRNGGIATSGDYRNFREIDGVRVDHVIDPRTGAPANNSVASVTVIHPQAMFADAYATTIMVLGGDAGMAFANNLDLAVLLIEKSADGGFIERYTPPMRSHFSAPPE